jgi:CHAD domain-containing protein
VREHHRVDQPDALGRAAASRRAALVALIAGERAQAFVLDLVRFTETRGWLKPEDFEQTARLAEPLRELAAAALEKRWKKVRKRARHLEELDAEHRHELRKELKKLRYAVEFLAPLYAGKKVEPFLKRLKKLQDVFGQLNDAALVRSMFSGDGPAAGASERAVGWLIGATQARAHDRWTGAKALWKDLDGAKPFW